MELRDLPAIKKICIDEYCTAASSGEQLSLAASTGDWVDRQVLGLIIDTTMLLKIFVGRWLVGKENKSSFVSDHAVIVACIVHEKFADNEEEEHIVGMVEISQQPVIPNRNPPPFPFPLSLKRWYSLATRTPLQGWIANLLVVPTARGMGVGRLLVGAAEGLACTSWKNCQSVHLHCSADGSEGKISQHLYLSLGYKPEHGTPTYSSKNRSPNINLSWIMSSSSASSVHSDCYKSIYIVQGVPLLYLRKDITSPSGKC
jgi:GNAT superfamily N-acetyltransferase